MTAIHIKRHIDSETLVIPELRALIGHDVEILVLNDELPKNSATLNHGFEASFGKYPDFDESAFLAIRDASKL